MNLKDNLKKIRKENNLSQEDLAEKLNVSRQSVSKWEQGIAYPEMDKVLQICKMFNLNIDEFLNQDINKAEKNKQSKINVNKYIDDFLAFVTKTVKMFSSMKFKDILKCLIEQLFIIFVLFIISAILGSILTSVFEGIFSFLKGEAYSVLYNIFSGIYYALYTVFAVIVLLHIFKIRYLDYYVIVDKEEVEETEVKEEKKTINKKEEKIIIRDPDHSGYKFINGIGKIFIFFVKCFVFLIGLNFVAALIGFAMLLALSFTFVKTGLLFVGGFLGSLCGIALNLVIIYLIYCFVMNMKINKMGSFIVFASSLILGGISIGLVASGFKDFKIVNDYNPKYMATTKEEMNMSKDLVILDHSSNVEYVESNNNNIKIEYKHFKSCKVETIKEEKSIYFVNDCDGTLIKDMIDQINDKVFVDPSIYKVFIYTNKENIKTLKNNGDKYYKELNDLYAKENTIRELENKIDDLERQLNDVN